MSNYDVARRRWEPHLTVGNRTGILLLHGFSTAPDMFHQLHNKLASAGYTTSAPLLSGHGTEPDALKSICYQDWLNDADCAYKELSQHCTHIVIIGISLGASLALYLAAKYSDIIGLVIINPLINLPGTENFYQETLASTESYINRIEPLLSINQHTFYYPYYPTRTVQETLALSSLIFDRLVEIKSPIIYFSSRSDQITASRQIANEVLTTVSSKMKYMYTLQGASYHQTFDRENLSLIYKTSLKFIEFILK